MTAYETAWGVPDPFITAAELASQPCASEYGTGDADELTQLERAVQGASELLYILSGRTVRGLTTETVRPALPGHEDCSLSYRSRTKSILLNWPIDTIDTVMLDGEEITDWVVLDNRELLRGRDADGRPQWWPDGQRLDLEDTEADTWSITYTWGLELPVWATDAAVELGCALLEFERRGYCDRLPDNVTGVTRQGVSYSLQAQAEQLRTGATHESLPATTRFISLINPTMQIASTYAYSPDVHRLYRVTVPVGGS